MKSTSLYLLLILVSIIHLQSSCIRENTEPKVKELPPITSQGKNTIGFLLNDKVWLPGGGAIGRPDIDFVLDTFNKAFRVICFFEDIKSPTIRQDFLLLVDWPEYTCYSGINNIIEPNGNRFLSDYTLQDTCINFSQVNLYEVNILYCNLNDKIISGTFSLEIENQCGDTYQITEGRFDAKFRIY